AEDGIRDLTVTGVQTCALPIFFLEVIAERKIPEHLEERVVARRLADLVEIVVLAAGAHALLRRRRALVRALLDAGEHVLELVHRSEERRVGYGGRLLRL